AGPPRRGGAGPPGLLPAVRLLRGTGPAAEGPVLGRALDGRRTGFGGVGRRGGRGAGPAAGRAGGGGALGMRLFGVIPWGRSFEEYRLMFALSADDLGGPTLGCGDGPASFNAEATKQGHRVVSCDPLYAFSAFEIERRVADCYDNVISQVRQGRDGYVWGRFRGPDHLGECRLAAMRLFLADFEKGKREGRYLTASLP